MQLPNVPAIPMVKVLAQWAAARNIPFDRKNWDSIRRVYARYCLTASNLN